MKTNKTDIRALKSKHRLELVMQEAGERFEADASKPEVLHSLVTPGLSVDLRRQVYEIKKPGLDPEAGDVIAWLRRRYGWSFAMAISFLEKRNPDLKQESKPALQEIRQPAQPLEESQEKALDPWQEKALQICGEKIREYFSWSWHDLIMLIDETRIEPVHTPEISHCPRCGSRIDWNIEKAVFINTDPHGNVGFRHEHYGPIPVLAYSIKRRIKVSDLGLEGSKELDQVLAEAQISGELRRQLERLIANSFDGLISKVRDLFVEEEDGVVCTKCAWQEYDFQNALELCRKSARRRERAAAEERAERDRAAWLAADREREAQERAECAAMPFP